jgi:biotin synthase-like enzyme
MNNLAPSVPKYDASVFTHIEDISLSKETLELLDKANKVYLNNFDSRIWYGRCIFLSWYCSRGTCKFCYRSTPKHQAIHGPNSKRSMASVLLEALFCKIFKWRIEFLTGGYEIMPFEQLSEYMKNISLVYGEKLWLNLGVLTEDDIKKSIPYVKGICSSIETPSPEIHNFICPDKPILPYEKMFESLELNHPNVKKSAAFIVGLGDKQEDLHYWFEFIEKYKLDRITVYALKPVRGTIFLEGPTHDLYLSWIAQLRIKFPRLEIIGGTNLRRSEEVKYMIRAGVNAITKYPATKQFGTEKSKLIKQLIESEGRTFTSNIVQLPDIDWFAEIDALNISAEYKIELKALIPSYLNAFRNPKDKDSKYSFDE